MKSEKKPGKKPVLRRPPTEEELEKLRKDAERARNGYSNADAIALAASAEVMNRSTKDENAS